MLLGFGIGLKVLQVAFVDAMSWVRTSSEATRELVMPILFFVYEPHRL